jgi:hypothetical protein
MVSRNEMSWAPSTTASSGRATGRLCLIGWEVLQSCSFQQVADWFGCGQDPGEIDGCRQPYRSSGHHDENSRDSIRDTDRESPGRDNIPRNGSQNGIGKGLGWLCLSFYP